MLHLDKIIEKHERAQLGKEYISRTIKLVMGTKKAKEKK